MDKNIDLSLRNMGIILLAKLSDDFPESFPCENPPIFNLRLQFVVVIFEKLMEVTITFKIYRFCRELVSV